MIETSLNANIGETSATIMCSFVDQWLVVCNVHKLLHQDRPGHFCPQSCTAWFKFDLHSSTCTDDHCVFVQNALGSSLIILSKKDQKSIYIYILKIPMLFGVVWRCGCGRWFCIPTNSRNLGQSWVTSRFKVLDKVFVSRPNFKVFWRCNYVSRYGRSCSCFR